MKLEQDKSPVVISGAAGDASDFQIVASPEAFKILSSGLYTNKIRAIIRELSCNAYDAHVAAGKADQPFTLHLPTAFDPYFSVKDDGTGLEYINGGCKPCHGIGTIQRPAIHPWEEGMVDEKCKTCDGTGDYDAVKELYCTYFSTNKSDSNLFIGALGLGSKSPFCYTDGFSVTNSYNGVTRIYSAFISASGKPSVVLQTVQQTPDAPNGVEVSFPVKQKDVWEFENQARYALELFDPAPILNISIRIVKKDYSLRMASWALRKDEYDSPQAIQGRVRYNIGDIDESRLTYEQQQMVKLPLDLFFDIGALSVAASRESLSNDERTIDNILEALDAVRLDFMAEVQKQIAACRTPWDAMLLIHNKSNERGIGKLVDRAFKAGEFEGVNPNFKIAAKQPQINQLDFQGVDIYEFSRSYRGKGIQALKRRTTADLAEQDLSERSLFDMEFEIDSNKQTKFVVNDVGHGTEKYVHHLVQNVENATVYFITRANKNVAWEDVTQTGWRMVKKLGQPPVVMMSRLKALYKDEFTRTGNGAKPRKVLRFKGSGDRAWRNHWVDATNETLPKGLRYYVPIKQLEPQVGNFNSSHHMSHFVEAVRSAGLFGLKKDTPVYGVSVNRAAKLDGSWIELFTHVMTRLKVVMTPKMETRLGLYKSGYSFSSQLGLSEIANNSSLADDSKLRQFAKLYDRCCKHRSVMVAVTTLLEIAEQRKIMTYNIEESVDLSALWGEIVEAYPLLASVSKGWRTSTEEFNEHITQYVRLIDEQNQSKQLGATFALSLSDNVVQTTVKDNDYAN